MTDSNDSTRPARHGGTALRQWRDWAVLTGRLLLSVLFLGGAAQKITDPGPAMALLTMRGLPEALLWPALAYNLIAGLALVLGWRMMPVALSLAAYCGATSWFHLQPDDTWQMTIFVKNWSTAGGCLVLAAYGAGRFSLDARR